MSCAPSNIRSNDDDDGDDDYYDKRAWPTEGFVPTSPGGWHCESKIS